MVENLEYYKVFYYVAKERSVTGAAQKLAISQPAVSQSMKQLESVLGAKLIMRSARGIRLTPEGEVLYEYVRRGYEEIENGERVLERLLNLESGEVRIGASDMTLEYYLLGFLEVFHESYPGIKVHVTNGPTPETVQYLKEGRIDFGIVTGPIEFSEDEMIEAVPVRQIEDVFVAAHKFTHLKNHMLSFEDLLEYPIIFLEKNTSTRKYVDGVLKNSGVILHPEFELATSDMIVQFALKNLGIGCVVRDFAKEQLEKGKLFELRFKQMIPKRQMYIIKNSQLPSSRAAEKLLELLHKV